jgi:hypothetical protein
MANRVAHEHARVTTNLDVLVYAAYTGEGSARHDVAQGGEFPP